MATLQKKLKKSKKPWYSMEELHTENVGDQQEQQENEELQHQEKQQQQQEQEQHCQNLENKIDTDTIVVDETDVVNNAYVDAIDKDKIIGEIFDIYYRRLKRNDKVSDDWKIRFLHILLDIF